MDGKMLCPHCGRELPEESQFCPYCMTKFGEEKKIENSELSTKRSGKKSVIIIAAVCVVIAAIVAVVAVKLTGVGSMDAGDSSDTSGSLSQDAPVTEETQPVTADTQPVAELTDSSLGSTSGAYAEKNPAAKLFDSSFISVPYSQLISARQTYGGVKIKFECIVLKVDGNTVFVEYGASRGFDGIYSSTGNYAAVKFDKPVSDLAYGDSVIVYGSFISVDSYDVGGKDYTIPTVEAKSYSDFVYFDFTSPVFTQDEIAVIAQSMFGKNTSVRASAKEDFADSSIADIIFGDGLFYTAESGNEKYCFYAGEDSFVYDCSSNGTVEKYILPAADSEHIYCYTLNKNSKSYTLECYDKKSKLIWQREFEDSYDAVIDYTDKYIYLVANASLYVLDTATGENAAKPQYVGNKCEIMKLEDGLILASPSASGAVMKTDLSGDVIWTADLAYDMPNLSSDAPPPFLQSVSSGYLISYEAQENGYTVGTYTALITPDGKVSYENIEN